MSSPLMGILRLRMRKWPPWQASSQRTPPERSAYLVEEGQSNRGVRMDADRQVVQRVLYMLRCACKTMLSFFETNACQPRSLCWLD